jgi:Kef-type K+ transport system membrane component KefB/nucleotide-binding universal stress UspA family protein
VAQEALTPLAGHAVALLLIQVALILIAARLGAELAKRVGLPAVVGELAAGIALGPSLLGHFAPATFALIFPHVSEQFHLLEIVGSLGMVLLLLLTGLETDLRLLKNLGRAALIASAMGMVVPFVTGFGLGLVMPDQYLAQPNQRVLFSAFLATAMSISAMPVIAKILMDLDLTKRNIGLVILSAGVVDDTAGWLILSVIAGAASHGELRFGSLIATLALTAAFLGAAAFLVYPLSRWSMSVATRRFKTPDADLVLLLVVTLLCAAATEHIGIHAVFGAFVAGTLFRQVTHMKAETVHKLESFVFAVLAPVFFGIVGLKVDLWRIGGGGMLAVVLGVACFGKLVGCTLGSIWGGLRFWEALSIAVAMNARGAMELVVATIGLSLGILNQQMFSIIVMVAITTSFLAPLGLRLTMKKVRMTEEEARRIQAEQLKGVFDPARVRVLLPTGGGPNTPGAALIVGGLTRRSANPVELMHINAPTSWRDFIGSLFRPRPAQVAAEEQLATLKDKLGGGLAPAVRRATHDDVARAILERAQDGFDLIALGASHRGHSLGGRVLAEVVEAAPCHVLIAKTSPEATSLGSFRHVLVPFDGGVFARVAVEFAVRYAEATGARVTIAVLTERRPQLARYTGEFAAVVPPVAESAEELSLDEELARISNIFLATEIKPQIVRLAYDPASSAMSDEAASGKYDLVVLGAENRAVQHRLFFGYDNERLISNSKLNVAIVIPNVAFLSKEDTSAMASLQRPRATPGEATSGRPVPSLEG